MFWRHLCKGQETDLKPPLALGGNCQEKPAERLGQPPPAHTTEPSLERTRSQTGGDRKVAVRGENGPALTLVFGLCGTLGLDVQYVGSLTNNGVCLCLPRAVTSPDPLHPGSRAVIDKMSIGIPASHPLSSGLKTRTQLLCAF